MWLGSPADVYVYVDTLDDAGGGSGGNSDVDSSSGGGVAMVMPRWCDWRYEKMYTRNATAPLDRSETGSKRVYRLLTTKAT